MKRLFPEMTDRPEKFMPVATIGYWIFAFVLMPVYLPLIGDGLWEDTVAACWLDFAYHAVNALVIVGMYRGYLGDSFFNVQLDPRRFIKTVVDALLALLLVALVLYVTVPATMDAYPINEMDVAVSAGWMVEHIPVFGILCHTLFTTVAVVGLFYAVGFAPMCCRKPWLGYLMVAFLLMLPAGFDILWRGEWEFVMRTYLLRLPIHLIACWSYQKADTVWAPLTTLVVFNLVTSLLSMFLI